jgi:hypothetical protein
MTLRLFPMILVASSILSCKQQVSTTELFKSSVIMPVNSSTKGVEGPAVDKAGTLYWVNYERQGTIGKLSPGGSPAVFIDLPEGSIGNGIRFGSKIYDCRVYKPQCSKWINLRN